MRSILAEPKLFEQKIQPCSCSRCLCLQWNPHPTDPHHGHRSGLPFGRRRRPPIYPRRSPGHHRLHDHRHGHPPNARPRPRPPPPRAASSSMRLRKPGGMYFCGCACNASRRAGQESAGARCWRQIALLLAYGRMHHRRPSSPAICPPGTLVARSARCPHSSGH